MKTRHWTSRDLDLLPEDGKRYEIIDGELYVAKQPDWEHQFVCVRILMLLQTWSDQLPLLAGFSCKVEQLFVGIAR